MRRASQISSGNVVQFPELTNRFLTFPATLISTNVPNTASAATAGSASRIASMVRLSFNNDVRMRNNWMMRLGRSIVVVLQGLVLVGVAFAP